MNAFLNKIGWRQLGAIGSIVLSMALLLPTSSALASGSLTLSKRADFSTSDLSFTRQEVLYMRVVDSGLDFNDIKDNEFRLKPNSGGDEVKGSFNNNLNGTYTAQVQLSTLSSHETQWEVRVKIKDNYGNEFETRVSITIAGNGPGDRQEVEFRGKIEQLGTSSLVVDGRKIFVDASTKIFDHRGLGIALADLRLGQTVEVKTERRNDGNLWALRIKIEDQSGSSKDEVEIRGRIKAIATDHVVIMQFAFFVDNNTVILDNRNNAIRFSDLKVGQLVQVRSKRQPDGSLLATKVKIEDLPDDEVELTGAIEKLGDNFLVVLGKKFVVDRNTVILDNNNNPIKFTDLKMGLIVEVRADRLADGTLLATRIKLEDLPDDEVEVTGAISALEDNSLVVLGLKFVVDANTVILDNNNNPIKFTDLKIGLIVEIRADRKADGTLLATKIKIEDRMKIQGMVSSLDNGSLSVAGIAVAFDANTQFRDQNNRPLTSQDLRIGELVEVQTVQQTPNSLAALSVKKTGTLTTVATDQSSNGLPENFVLQQNYPNPFNPSTTIRFTVPLHVGAPQVVTLRIYNVMGEVVRTLVNQAFAAGSYIAVWNGKNDRGVKVSSGMYFYELKAGNFTVVKRMMLAK